MSVRPTYEGERTGVDADGTIIREYDGVRLLRAPAAPARAQEGVIEGEYTLVDKNESRLGLR